MDRFFAVVAAGGDCARVIGLQGSVGTLLSVLAAVIELQASGKLVTLTRSGLFAYAVCAVTDVRGEAGGCSWMPQAAVQWLLLETEVLGVVVKMTPV